MKKVLQVCGVLFIVALVALGSLFGWGAVRSKQLNASSQSYVDSAVPAIVSGWSQNELMSRATPQMAQAVNEQQRSRLFSWFSTSLGPLKNYCGSKGNASEIVNPKSGKTISARYQACAKFQNGEATISVVLLQNTTGTWQIAGFHVRSAALSAQRAQPSANAPVPNAPGSDLPAQGENL